MKLNQIITGLALAAGLLAFAPVQSQAAPAGNLPIIPLNIKVVGTYVTSVKTNSAKIVKFTYSNKDILSYAGAPKGSKLAFTFGMGNDIVIVHNNTIWTNLTAGGVLYFTSSDYSDQEILGKNGAYKYISAGTIEFVYNSNGNDASIGDNEFGFDVTGSYLAISASSAANKKGAYTVSVKLATSGLSGEAVDNDVDTGDGGYMPAVGVAGIDGSVRLVVP